MRLGSMVAALLLTLASALAQDSALPAQPSDIKPQDLCTVEGVVVKATTGEGLKKIDVTLYPADGNRQPQGALTDANGHFVLSGLAPGRYTLNAAGNGYPSQIYGQKRGRGAPKILMLTPGSHEKDIVFRLMPPGVITGTVYDEDGAPVVNAQVQAIRIAHAGPHRQMFPTNGAQTNDQGQYRIYGLEPGQYLVLANFQRSSPTDTSSDELYLPTFYPGTVDLGQATPVRVQPGDEASGIDLDLRPARGVRVRGQVVSDVPLKKLQGLYVSLVPREKSLAGLGYGRYGGPIQDEKGTFEIRGVPPGSYVLALNWGDGTRSFFGRTTVEVGSADVEGVTLALGPGLTLQGRVRIDPGTTLDFTRLGLWLQPADTFLGGAGAQIKPDGTFVIENVMEDTYRLRVGGFPEEFYVKSASLGGLDVLGPGLTVTRGQPPGPLEVTLSLDGGRIDGVVLQDQKPFPGAQVVLVPDPPDRNRDELYSFKISDPLGRFSLLGLPPGNFKLFAFEPHEGLSPNDPEFIKDYEKRGTAVHIEEKQQQYVQLELIPADEEPQ